MYKFMEIRTLMKLLLFFVLLFLRIQQSSVFSFVIILMTRMERIHPLRNMNVLCKFADIMHIRF